MGQKWTLGVFLLSVLLIPCRMASAQQWCYECGSGSDCSTACWFDAGDLRTCGEWGTCYEISHNCGYACNSGVDCNTYCYNGEWPNGQDSTCGAAGRPCSNCQPNYNWGERQVGVWQQVYYFGDGTPLCDGYRTWQNVGVDTNNCPNVQHELYGDCRVEHLTGPVYNQSNCCPYLYYYGGCGGQVWPASCTN